MDDHGIILSIFDFYKNDCCILGDIWIILFLSIRGTISKINKSKSQYCMTNCSNYKKIPLPYCIAES